ncbi:DUF6207 family protein [Streptomyces sp. NPDC006259]|uniref:DUF6207 family protein n=1 Tax=Streptomyces sp. NPDC006259 TaxID=3364740 RepID=UPI0036A93B95
MKTPQRRNPLASPGVVPYMDPINEAHVSEPGLLVVDIAAADDATALAFQQLLAERWATATAERTTRDAGEPGVRLRCYPDLHQPISPAPEPAERRVPGRARRDLHHHVAPSGRVGVACR